MVVPRREPVPDEIEKAPAQTRTGAGAVDHEPVHVSRIVRLVAPYRTVRPEQPTGGSHTSGVAQYDPLAGRDLSAELLPTHLTRQPLDDPLRHRPASRRLT
jgi:hypothetical protein